LTGDFSRQPGPKVSRDALRRIGLHKALKIRQSEYEGSDYEKLQRNGGEDEVLLPVSVNRVRNELGNDQVERVTDNRQNRQSYDQWPVRFQQEKETCSRRRCSRFSGYLRIHREWAHVRCACIQV
jgi:hypothetical protein